MKSRNIPHRVYRGRCRSREGAWIEIVCGSGADTASRRSREGAWIEIRRMLMQQHLSAVAPVRERGLKCCVHEAKLHLHKSLP